MPLACVFLRMVGKSNLFPRKLRSMLIRQVVGEEGRCEDYAVDTRLYGKKFIGSTRSHIDWAVYFFGVYDPLGTTLLRHLARQIPGAVYMDVGANVGTHMLAVSEYCKQLHCFEPYPRALESLERHVAINDLTQANVHKFGLSDSNVVMDYYENSTQNFGAGSFEKDHGNLAREAAYQLPLRVGDEVVDELGIQRIDLIKIDVEGHELSVLRGLREKLVEHRPFVFWEFGPTTLGLLEDEASFLSLFPEDYVVYGLTHRERWTRSKPKLTPFNYPELGNLLAVPVEKKGILERLF